MLTNSLKPILTVIDTKWEIIPYYHHYGRVALTKRDDLKKAPITLVIRYPIEIMTLRSSKEVLLMTSASIKPILTVPYTKWENILKFQY